MSKPLIAVPAYRLAAGRITRWDAGGFAAPEWYVESLARAGARPVLLTSPDDGDPAEILEPFDGLLLMGAVTSTPSCTAPSHTTRPTG